MSKEKWIVGLAVLVVWCVGNVSSAADLEQGKRIYDGIGACATCHGAKGMGDGAAAAVLDPKPRKFSEAKFKFDTDKDGKTGTVADLKNIVTKGTAPFGGSIMMAPRPDISGQNLDNLVAYIRKLGGKTAKPAKPAETAP